MSSESTESWEFLAAGGEKILGIFTWNSVSFPSCYGWFSDSIYRQCTPDGYFWDKTQLPQYTVASFREKPIGRIGFDACVSSHEFIVELSIFTCLVAKLDGFTQFDFSEQIYLECPPICDETE